MNILKQDPRRSVIRKLHPEYLDDRIVPSTVQPALAAAAEVATAHATLDAAAATGETSTADTKPQNHEIKREIRHENRIIKLEARHEAAKVRRHALLEKLASRRAIAHQLSSAVVVPTNTSGTPVVTSFSRPQSAIVSNSIDSGSGSTPPVMPVTTTPGTTSSGTASSGTVSSGTASSGSASSATGSTGTTTTTTNPLQDNVSVLLDTVYQEYENGDLTTTNQPGQVEIQGSNVGVQIRVSNSADFDTMLAQAESLGLQVTTSSAAYDMVDGFLPIAELPAAAQLPGTPSIAPLLYPTTNNGGALAS